MLGLITCLALLLLLCIGTLRKSAVAFAAVLCLYGLKQWGQSSSSLFATNRTLINFAIAILVAIGMIREWRSNVDVRSMSTAWLLGLILYAYAFITLAWSPDIDVALNRWSLEIPYVLMIAVVAPLLLKRTEDFRIASDWTLLVGGVVCLLALVFGKWGNRGLLVNGDFLRSETNPLAIASLGGTISVIAMVSVMAPMSRFKRILCFIAALVGIAVILRSGSRGQLVAAILAVLIGMPMAAKKRSIGAWLTMVILVAVVAQIGWWIWDQMGVNSARWSGERSSEDAEGRLTMATALISAATSDPVKFIVGTSNSSAFHYLGFYPHVAALEVLAEEGIIGISLYVAIVVLAIRSAIKLDAHARLHNDFTVRYVVAILTALFVFEWFLTFKQGSLLSSVYAIAYAGILGRLAKRADGMATSINSEVTLEDRGSSLPNLMR